MPIVKQKRRTNEEMLRDSAIVLDGLKKNLNLKEIASNMRNDYQGVLRNLKFMKWKRTWITLEELAVITDMRKKNANGQSR